MKVQKYIVIVIFVLITAIAIVNIVNHFASETKEVEVNGREPTLPIEYPKENNKAIEQTIITIKIIENESTIYVNNEPKELDVAPFTDLSTYRTIAPIRIITEAMGANVHWLADDEQVKIIYKDIEMVLTIDSEIIIVNGDLKLMEHPAQLINGRTVAPIRFVGENLGAMVEWYEDETTEKRSRDAPQLIEVIGFSKSEKSEPICDDKIIDKPVNDKVAEEKVVDDKVVDDKIVEEKPVDDKVYNDKIYDDRADDVAFMALNYGRLDIDEAYHIADLVVEYSDKHNLDPMVVASMISVESNFNHQAVGKAQDTGLMQIIPSTASFIARGLGESVGDLKDPETNIRYGTWYLAHNRNVVSGYTVFDSTGRELDTIEKAIIAYNRGSGYVVSRNGTIVDTTYLDKVKNVKQ